MKNKKLYVVAEICRIIMGLTFIFSGFIKTIDPWGTAVKMVEYFNAFHFEWLSEWSVVFAIWLCAGELMMGCMLTFRVRTRMVSIFALLSMTLFTILTFVLAVWNPIDDCGCFGDAIKLDNWVSFGKNIVLLGMSVVLWYSRRGQKIFNFSTKEIILTFTFMTLAGILAIYSWRHLPPIDLYPYKRGVDMRSDALCTAYEENATVLVYRDKETGEVREFLLSDTGWHDGERWEYVDMRSPYDGLPEKMLEKDFALYREGVNFAGDIVSHEGIIYMVCVREIDKVPWGCARRVEKSISRLRKQGEDVICLVGVAGDDEAPIQTVLAGHTLPCYGIDMELLALMLRADMGLIVMENGVIKDKRTCWQMK